MKGEFKLLWATDVGAHFEAEHVGLEVFPSKAACEASDLVVECGERAVPVVFFVPFEDEETVLAAAKAFELVNVLNAACSREDAATSEEDLLELLNATTNQES